MKRVYNVLVKAVGERSSPTPKRYKKRYPSYFEELSFGGVFPTWSCDVLLSLWVSIGVGPSPSQQSSCLSNLLPLLATPIVFSSCSSLSPWISLHSSKSSRRENLLDLLLFLLTLGLLCSLDGLEGKLQFLLCSLHGLEALVGCFLRQYLMRFSCNPQ